jgi:putative SOS response-associated peptidase YedK
MCGRYAVEKLDREYIQFMRDAMKAAPKVPKSRYNVAPTQSAPILRIWDGKPKFDDVRWQLYEAWWKDISRGPQINARADKVFTNSMYKHSMAKRRCLVLATGWYEWPKKPKSGLPHFIHKKDSAPVMFAGIWSTYHSDEKKIHQDNFAIITTEAHKIIEPFHDRMPVIINPKDYDTWLDPECRNPLKLSKLLHPYKGRDLEAYTVSTYVNSPKNTGEECVRPSIHAAE